MDCEVAQTPKRRCMHCRGNGKKIALLRFVVFQGVLCFDLRQKLPGRGFYVCAHRACLENAFSKRLKAQTKRDAIEIAPDVETFIAQTLIPGFRRRYSELLLAGFRSHQLLLGSDAVEQAAREDALSCYVIATDASASTDQKYRTNAERKNLPCCGLLPRSEYGRLFGKSDKVVLGWLPGALSDEFQAIETALRRLDICQLSDGD